MWSVVTWPVRSRPARRVLVASLGLLVRRRLADGGHALSSVGRTQDRGRARWPWLLVLAVAGVVAGAVVLRRRQDDRPAHAHAPRATQPTAGTASDRTPTPGGARTGAVAPAPPRNGLTDRAPGSEQPDLASGAAVIGRTLAADDLKVIEGIGPKIEQLLNDNGVHTWQDLAAADVERLRGILQDAGSRYRMHDPGTWPRQAALLVHGDWEGFRTLNDGGPDM